MLMKNKLTIYTKHCKLTFKITKTHIFLWCCFFQILHLPFYIFQIKIILWQIFQGLSICRNPLKGRSRNMIKYLPLINWQFGWAKIIFSLMLKTFILLQRMNFKNPYPESSHAAGMMVLSLSIIITLKNA